MRKLLVGLVCAAALSLPILSTAMPSRVGGAAAPYSEEQKKSDDKTGGDDVAKTPQHLRGKDNDKKNPPALKVKGPKVKLPEDVPQYLQDISVTIRAGRAEGSGIITNINGDCYVLTCGHLVAHLRTTREVIDSGSGSKKTVVEFNDAEVIKDDVEDGRAVGHMRYYAEVVRYSDADHGEDLALLRVRKKGLTPKRVFFYLEKKIPSIGTDLYHVGSLLGHGGSNSMTGGIMSQHGRVYEGQVYDQTTCAAFRGSSGGGVYLKDGRYVAMVVRGAGETFNLVVPIRRIYTWSKRVGVDFVLDPDVKAPSAEEVKKTPPEANLSGKRDACPRQGGKDEKSVKLKFMIRSDEWKISVENK